jgi:hypothetical protein
MGTRRSKNKETSRSTGFMIDLQEVLTRREQRILDWHFFRMKAWGIAIPALFLASFKPVDPPSEACLRDRLLGQV